MKPQVIFYYPQHFNRSSNGTNPFFDPIVDLCSDMGILYKYFEEPSGSSFPKDRRAKQVSNMLGFVIILRKLMRILHIGESDEHRDYISGRIFNILTFGRYKSPITITISNSMSDFWMGVNPEGKVYDMQHGIIYSTHPGYFDKNAILLPHMQHAQKRFLVWGEIFKNSFYLNPLNKQFGDDKVTIIGYPVKSDRDKINIVKCNLESRDTILFSLQLTCDLDNATLNHHKSMLVKAISDVYNKGYKIKIKHHPRFENIINIDDIFDKYPSVELTTESIDRLSENIRLHITWDSTTTFEYASRNIPTFFLRDEFYDKATPIFYNEYDYPLFADIELRDISPFLFGEEYNKVCSLVKDWYNRAYTPFDSKILHRLINVNR